MRIEVRSFAHPYHGRPFRYPTRVGDDEEDVLDVLMFEPIWQKITARLNIGLEYGKVHLPLANWGIVQERYPEGSIAQAGADQPSGAKS
jgi:hypothetical protein